MLTLLIANDNLEIYLNKQKIGRAYQMKKIFSIIIFNFILLVLCSCNQSENLSKNEIQKLTTDEEKKVANDSKSDNNTNISDEIYSPDLSTTTLSADDKIIITMDSSILGTFNTSTNEWSSIYPTDAESEPAIIKVGDVLSKSKYYIYIQDSFLGTTNEIVWIYYPEYEGFGSMNGNYMLKKASDELKLLASDGYNSNDFMFKLPVRLEENLYSTPIPSESFLSSFVWQEVYLPDYYEHCIGLSEKMESEFYLYSEKYDVSEATQQLINSKFNEKKLNHIVPFIKFCYKGDFDNDQKDEYLTVINNEKDESTGAPVVETDVRTDETAYYNFVVYEDDNGDTFVLEEFWNLFPESKAEINGTKKVYTMAYWMDEFILTDAFFVGDINNNGTAEIIISLLGKTGSKSVYALKDNIYHKVINSIVYYE